MLYEKTYEDFGEVILVMRGFPKSILLLTMFSLALSQPVLGQEQNTTAPPYTVCTLNRPPMVRIC